LGAEAADLNQMAQQRHQSLGGQSLPMGFGDFFFQSDDPLHPDSPNFEQGNDDLDEFDEEDF
jgi:hypothetical protein